MPSDMGARDSILLVLRELIRQIQSIDDQQLADVVTGRSKLEIRIIGRKQQSHSKKRPRLTDEQLDALRQRLTHVRTREEGNQLLDEKVMSKDDLTRLARQLDTPVQKGDSAEQIRARIIEATIGFRIRSAAIQGVAVPTTDKSIE